MEKFDAETTKQERIKGDLNKQILCVHRLEGS